MRARNGDLLDHVRTLAFARDIDVLRAALGDRWINYYGLSYGTFLGQVLANTFPTRTGALVLDGVVDPAWASGPAGSISWLRENAAAGSWQTLHRFFQLCTRARPAHCAFAAGGDPQHKYALLADRLRTHPLMIPVPGSPAQPLGYSELVGATISTLYFGPAWPLPGELLQAAYLRDAPRVALLAQQLAHHRPRATTTTGTPTPRSPARTPPTHTTRAATARSRAAPTPQPPTSDLSGPTALCPARPGTATQPSATPDPGPRTPARRSSSSATATTRPPPTAMPSPRTGCYPTAHCSPSTPSDTPPCSPAPARPG
jgi:pimeloyl-ACP methyl ester carboxylesterase